MIIRDQLYRVSGRKIDERIGEIDDIRGELRRVSGGIGHCETAFGMRFHGQIGDRFVEGYGEAPLGRARRQFDRKSGLVYEFGLAKNVFDEDDSGDGVEGLALRGVENVAVKAFGVDFGQIIGRHFAGYKLGLGEDVA